MATSANEIPATRVVVTPNSSFNALQQNVESLTILQEANRQIYAARAIQGVHLLVRQGEDAVDVILGFEPGRRKGPLQHTKETAETKATYVEIAKPLITNIVHLFIKQESKPGIPQTNIQVFPREDNINFVRMEAIDPSTNLLYACEVSINTLAKDDAEKLRKYMSFQEQRRNLAPSAMTLLDKHFYEEIAPAEFIHEAVLQLVDLQRKLREIDTVSYKTVPQDILDQRNTLLTVRGMLVQRLFTYEDNGSIPGVALYAQEAAFYPYDFLSITLPDGTTTPVRLGDIYFNDSAKQQSLLERVKTRTS